MSRPSLGPSLRVTVLVSILTSFSAIGLLIFLQPYMRPELLHWLFPAANQPMTQLEVPPAVMTSPSARSDEDAVIRVVQHAKSAVVAVLVYSDSPAVIASFGLDKNAPPPDTGLTPSYTTSTAVQVGGGSGFFLTEDGLLVTNKHVVDFDRASFRVMTSVGHSYPATLVAKDPVLDLAFLRVKGNGFPFLNFADSDKLLPGQTAIAIGNAFDEFRNSVTKGIISGLNRRVFAGDGFSTEFIEEAIQTDAAINPGNSGGPLLNIDGEVVGLNTAVSEQGQLIGFALPSNVVRRDADMVMHINRIVHPYLGVRYQILTEDYVLQNNLPVDHGALIVHGATSAEYAIAPGSPAETAGLLEGDIILEVDGQPVNEEHSLSALLGRYMPGETVTLRVYRHGTQKIIPVVLAELK